jgi:hypothetical protein
MTYPLAISLKIFRVNKLSVVRKLECFINVNILNVAISGLSYTRRLNIFIPKIQEPVLKRLL